MPNYRTSEDVNALRIEDGHEAKLHLKDFSLFASGAFSNVYRGTLESSNRATEVVIKKTWPRHRGVPVEVKILKRLNRLKHKNIVRLMYSYNKEYEDKVCLALIFEYVPLNLYQYLKLNNRRIGIIEIKMIAWQLFRGQNHLLRMDICHRDIKPQNLLFNIESGLLKISDFGSSAMEVKTAPQPSYHVTRYYRPPELLLNSKTYGCEVDVWSCGCVFGELLKGSVFLPGRNSNNQAELVFDLLGLPSSGELRDMSCSRNKYKEITQTYTPATKGPYPNFQFLTSPTGGKAVASRSATFSVHNNMLTAQDMSESVALLSKILVYSPLKRLHGHELLTHPYFAALFVPGVTRANGMKIPAITQRDLHQVKIGDTTVTGSAESMETEEQR